MNDRPIRSRPPVCMIYAVLLLRLGACFAAAESTTTGRSDDRPTFTNPIYEGADPWVIKKDARYYLCRSEGDLAVSVWRSDRLTDPGVKRIVWQAPAAG